MVCSTNEPRHILPPGWQCDPLESLNCTHGMNVEVKHHRFGSHFSPVMCVVKYFLLAAHARGTVKALFHLLQKQACCENFHPITIFESTHCKLASWLLR